MFYGRWRIDGPSGSSYGDDLKPPHAAFVCDRVVSDVEKAQLMRQGGEHRDDRC